MSFEAPLPCSYHAGCHTYEDNFDVLTGLGPETITHTISIDYSIGNGPIAGIPIEQVDRTFTLSGSMRFGMPNKEGIKFVSGDDLFYRIECQERPPTIAESTLSDKCTITHSSLHYLDLRYAMALVHTITDSLAVSVKSNQLCGFKTTGGGEQYHMLPIRESNYTVNRLDRWLLYVDGSPQTLSEEHSKLHPFGSKNSGKVDGITVDKEIRKIIVFQQPPSKGDALTDEIRALGFYDYGNEPGQESGLNREDGGLKDYFYPEWCRSLAPSSIWRQMAARRYDITWNHEKIKPGPQPYTLPPLTVEPIPKGSFVRHPDLGDFYQFLINRKAYSSPNLDNLIAAKLADGLSLGETTLYYPISLV